MSSLEDIAQLWQAERRFESQMSIAERAQLLRGWQDAVARTRSREV